MLILGWILAMVRQLAFSIWRKLRRIFMRSKYCWKSIWLNFLGTYWTIFLFSRQSNPRFPSKTFKETPKLFEHNFEYNVIRYPHITTSKVFSIKRLMISITILLELCSNFFFCPKSDLICFEIHTIKLIFCR